MDISGDVQDFFDEVNREVSQNLQQLMKQLWINWSNLGFDDTIKFKNIASLVQIEKDLHNDVLSETKQKLRNLQSEIDKLKEEAEELGQYLSLDINISEFKEELMLHQYKVLLESQIAGYREQVKQRRAQIERLLEWQRDLADKLGVTLQELPQMPLPNEEELNKFTQHLSVLQAERDKRTEVFLRTQMELKDIMEKLHIEPKNKFEHAIVTSLSVDYKVTDVQMDRLAKIKQEYQELYEQTNNRVLELRERLTRLWECLDEDQIYRDNFLLAHPGCHPETENSIKEEIKRCEQIKREKIQVFVANIRTKIKLMWDKMMYSTDDREGFIHYFQDIFTEDTLTLHEYYLERITKIYNENKNIYDLVATRKNLWGKMVELEGRATEPGRYHNRGGQLLREEKERKAIASNLPKIEEQIRELASQYEDKYGTPFTVEGKPLLQVMKDDWENRKTERHNKLSARKQALTPTSQQMLRSLATSPLGKRNRTAAGLAATADRNRPPLKRQLITGSASKAIPSAINVNSANKRTALSTVKRRLSGRLVAKARGEHNAKRKLDLERTGEEQNIKVPSIAINGFVVKRTSRRKRSSAGRKSTDTALCSKDTEIANKDPLTETTLLNSYSDFKENINENKISRSSMALPVDSGNVICSNGIRKNKTPMKQAPSKANVENTPTNNQFNTPLRSTRSAAKLDKEGFATPRSPFTVRSNLQRKNSLSLDSLKENRYNGAQTPSKTTPKVLRSKTTIHLTKVKNLPPLI